MRPDILLLLLLASGAFWITLQALFGWQVVVITAGACAAIVVIGAALDLRHKEEPVLTPRELAALIAYAQLEDYALAAGELGIALSTVKNHIHRAYRKLDTTNSLGAMKALGWLEIPR